MNENVKKQYNASFSDDEVAFIAIHFLNVLKESTK
ncbi:MAG: PRD domain-containing protein [Coprobacillaceae bacterium]